MPIYDLCRYVEQRYDVRIEAADEKEALKRAQSMTDAQWGEPVTTVSDTVIVFNDTGDEVALIEGD
jgi:hypothetical protein